MTRSVTRVLATIVVIAGAVLALRGSALVVPSGTWTGVLSNPRVNAGAALLADGRILVTGGDNGSGASATVDFFNTDGTILAAPPMEYVWEQQARQRCR
jgi:hypothetical protein